MHEGSPYEALFAWDGRTERTGLERDGKGIWEFYKISGFNFDGRRKRAGEHCAGSIG